MYMRWPQVPSLPPATAKFAFAFGFEGDTIQPPPVTKSVVAVLHGGGGDGDAGQVMSAWACAITTSASGAPPSTGLFATTCRALTSMLPDCPLVELDCSLMTT